MSRTFYIIGAGMGAPDSLTAGDVRAEYKNNCARALEYYRACAAAVCGLSDGGFYFGGVRAWEG